MVQTPFAPGGGTLAFAQKPGLDDAQACSPTTGPRPLEAMSSSVVIVGIRSFTTAGSALRLDGRRECLGDPLTPLMEAQLAHGLGQ